MAHALFEKELQTDTEDNQAPLVGGGKAASTDLQAGSRSPAVRVAGLVFLWSACIGLLAIAVVATRGSVVAGSGFLPRRNLAHLDSAGGAAAGNSHVRPAGDVGMLAEHGYDTEHRVATAVQVETAAEHEYVLEQQEVTTTVVPTTTLAPMPPVTRNIAAVAVVASTTQPTEAPQESHQSLFVQHGVHDTGMLAEHGFDTVAAKPDATRDDCHTAQLGEQCFIDVSWAMNEGMQTHPEWYHGLNKSSTFEDFQIALRKKKRGSCPVPCEPRAAHKASRKQEATATTTTAATTTAAPTSAATTTVVEERDCHTSCDGEKCFHNVMWAKTQGIFDHPDWYSGLTASSSFFDFQSTLHEANLSHCPKPCKTSSCPQAVQRASCLCLFDVDRTLTAKQGEDKVCPGTRKMHGVKDSAFAGGTLVLSELAQNMQKTFCGKCYRGIVTAGTAGGWKSEERAVLLHVLGGVNWTLSDEWSPPAPAVSSTLVVGAPDGAKHNSSRGIVDWLRTEKNVDIDDDNVFFFDDSVYNPSTFAGTGFNARQVSCATRDGTVGYCGARLEEVTDQVGVQACGGQLTV